MKEKRAPKVSNFLPKNVPVVIDENEKRVPEIHGNRIRAIRKEEHHTQEKMAELLKIDIKTLSNVENGDSLT